MLSFGCIFNAAEILHAIFSTQIQLLCISTSTRLLCMPCTGGNHLLLSQTEKEEITQNTEKGGSTSV